MTTGSTWSPTRTCPPRDDVRPLRRCDRDRLLFVDESGVAVVGAVKNLEGPEPDHHGREGHQHDKAHDREPKAEASALLSAQLFAFLLLEALERARADDPRPVPLGLLRRPGSTGPVPT